jgi:hypothetical protein
MIQVLKHDYGKGKVSRVKIRAAVKALAEAKVVKNGAKKPTVKVIRNPA